MSESLSSKSREQSLPISNLPLLGSRFQLIFLFNNLIKRSIATPIYCPGSDDFVKKPTFQWFDIAMWMAAVGLSPKTLPSCYELCASRYLRGYITNPTDPSVDEKKIIRHHLEILISKLRDTLTNDPESLKFGDYKLFEMGEPTDFVPTLQLISGDNKFLEMDGLKDFVPNIRLTFKSPNDKFFIDLVGWMETPSFIDIERHMLAAWGEAYRKSNDFLGLLTELANSRISLHVNLQYLWWQTYNPSHLFSEIEQFCIKARNLGLVTHGNGPIINHIGGRRNILLICPVDCGKSSETEMDLDNFLRQVMIDKNEYNPGHRSIIRCRKCNATLIPVFADGEIKISQVVCEVKGTKSDEMEVDFNHLGERSEIKKLVDKSESKILEIVRRRFILLSDILRSLPSPIISPDLSGMTIIMSMLSVGKIPKELPKIMRLPLNINDMTPDLMGKFTRWFANLATFTSGGYRITSREDISMDDKPEFTMVWKSDTGDEFKMTILEIQQPMDDIAYRLNQKFNNSLLTRSEHTEFKRLLFQLSYGEVEDPDEMQPELKADDDMINYIINTRRAVNTISALGLRFTGIISSMMKMNIEEKATLFCDHPTCNDDQNHEVKIFDIITAINLSKTSDLFRCKVCGNRLIISRSTIPSLVPIYGDLRLDRISDCQ